MRAFLTGSRAYGTPRSGSDVDVVVLMDPESIVEISKFADSSDRGSAEHDAEALIRFGRLNLIAFSEPEDVVWWRAGHDELMAMRPVTRAVAIEVLERHKTAAGRGERGQTQHTKPARLDMGANVSLLRLVAVANTRPLWTADFEAKAALLEDELKAGAKNGAAFGVIADWLDENEEPELADAFRYVFKRPAIELRYRKDGYAGIRWEVGGLPPATSTYFSRNSFDCDTVPGLMAALAGALAKARADVA